LTDTPQIESKIKSAKGIEYSKITRRMGKKVQVSVGVDEPGVEFNRRVVPVMLIIVWSQGFRSADFS
jgi:hypothetical protein